MDAAKVHPLAVGVQLNNLLEVVAEEPSRTHALVAKAARMWSSANLKLPLERGD